jgi:hypothetical protein
MVKIKVNEDRNNAPKKLFLRDFIIAVVRCDNDFLTRALTDDVSWNYIGGRCFVGKQNVCTELAKVRSKGVLELQINTIVTHGYDGVLEGNIRLTGGKTIAFCDVYEFRASTNNAPIKLIKTYKIKMT